MKVVHVPVLQDNYAYLLVDEATKTAAVVDPVEPPKVIAAAEAEGVTITTVLTTHKHWDHSGGNVEIAKAIPNLEIIGGHKDSVPGATKNVKDGDELALGSNRIYCIETPCHTGGHICYFVQDNEGNNAVFTGDTLFVAGCGRFFEGTANDMYSNLVEKLGKLPPKTAVYCGHEYTVNNIKFASSVDPDNAELQAKAAWVADRRASGKPTIPSSIAEELATNPFMRVHEPALKSATGASEPVDVMSRLRSMKDNFGVGGAGL